MIPQLWTVKTALVSERLNLLYMHACLIFAETETRGSSVARQLSTQLQS